LKEIKRYWDSSCFLAWLKKEPDKIDDCRGVIQGCENGQIKLITSTLTIAEVLYLKHNQKIPKTESGLIRDFFEHRYIITVAVDRTIAEKAQDLVWDYEIKPKDAIHAASAILSGTKILDTFDPDFLTFGKKTQNLNLQIGKPCFSYQYKINDKEETQK